jgi:hypothetical protein
MPDWLLRGQDAVLGEGAAGTVSREASWKRWESPRVTKKMQAWACAGQRKRHLIEFIEEVKKGVTTIIYL